MLDTYTSTPQTISANAPLNFDVVRINTCPAIQHLAGSPTVTLRAPGYYFVSFNGVASATAAATDPVVVQLTKNNETVPGGTTSSLSAATDTPVSLSFTTIVKVLPSCCSVDNTTSLQLVNSGIEALYSNAELVIRRACQ